MARPRKRRRVCSLPENNKFGPFGINHRLEQVIMTVDEYETIRLIDLEGLNQEECAEKMEVARTTVQSIYTEARKKIAEVLVNGKTLLIEGGDYLIYNDAQNVCGRGNRQRRNRN